MGRYRGAWFGFDFTLKRGASGPAVASLEVPLENRALLRRWRGFRTISGAPCIAALLDVCFPVD
jgi:hypothetical protein